MLAAARKRVLAALACSALRRAASASFSADSSSVLFFGLAPQRDVLKAELQRLVEQPMDVARAIKYAIDATAASKATVLLTTLPCHSSTAMRAPIEGPTTAQNDGR